MEHCVRNITLKIRALPVVNETHYEDSFIQIKITRVFCLLLSRVHTASGNLGNERIFSSGNTMEVV